MNSTNAMKRVGYGYVSRTEQSIIEKLSREEKRMQAIIYTKPHCQKCRRTVFKLSRVMPVQTITADADDYERFRKLGYRARMSMVRTKIVRFCRMRMVVT